MAGYVPGQQPANRSQEKEFVQAYEDVLERYKGAAGGAAGAGGSPGTPRAGRGGAHPGVGAGPRPAPSRAGSFAELR